MTEQIIFAGFGGQGVLSMGMLLTYAGMLEGKNVTWLPSYGPEMRGGTANCNVILSDDIIGSPIITSATAAVVMNRPSLDKFENKVEKGGLLLINSSLIQDKSKRTDIGVVYVHANEIATELENEKVANMVMLGAYLAKAGIMDPERILEALPKVLGESKAKFIPMNREALARGAKAVS